MGLTVFAMPATNIVISTQMTVIANKESRRGSTHQVSIHVGLLANEPPRHGRVALHLGIRQIHWQSCDQMRCNSTTTAILRRRSIKAIRLLFFLPSKVGVAIPAYSSQTKASYMTCERRSKNRLNHRRRPPSRRRTGHRVASPRGGLDKKTVGEIEAALCQGAARFEQDYSRVSSPVVKLHTI